MPGMYGGATTTDAPPKRKRALLLPNGDKLHPCGCETFWGANGKAVYYHKVCKAHKGYVNRLGLLASRSAN